MNLTITERVMKLLLTKRSFINYILAKNHKRVIMSASKAKKSIDGLQSNLLALDSNIATSTEIVEVHTKDLKETKYTLKTKSDVATETQMRTLAGKQVNLEILLEQAQNQLSNETQNIELIKQSIVKAKSEHGKLEAEVRNIESRMEQAKAMEKANLTLALIGDLDVKESLNIINGASKLSENAQRNELEQSLNQFDATEEERIKEIMSQNKKEIGA